MVLSPTSRRVLLASILLVSFWGIAWSHNRLRAFQVESRQSKDFFYFPDAKIVKPLFLGHEAFGADLVWIRTLSYAGDSLWRGRRLVYLDKLTDFITDLDPRFEQAYIWAGAISMYSGGRITKDEIRASNRILEKGWNFMQNDTRGWRHIKNYWMIPQMIGFNYVIELREKEKGVPFIVATSKIPGSPDLYKTWAATIYKKLGKMDEGTKHLESILAIETLQSQLENVDNKKVEQKIRGRLAHYYQNLYGEKEGRQRLKELEERIRKHLKGWRETMPYVSFDFYLLLATVPDLAVAKKDDLTWKAAFPLLDKAGL